MSKLSDYVVISDVDGTLLDERGIPPRNLEAIHRFQQQGGRFGIATGRSRGLMRKAVDGQVPINAPCIVYNGGALYDYNSDKILWEQFLPEHCVEYIRQLMDLVPDTGVMVVSADTYYAVRSVSVGPELRRLTDEHNPQYAEAGSLDDVKAPFYKVLFQVPHTIRPAFVQMLGEMDCPGVRFVGSSNLLFEMLPEDSNKGAALEQLVRQGMVDREHLVAVGDYYNDLEMLAYAGIGATLSTAPAELRETADLVVGDCRGGAVADVIEHLEKLCGA